MKIPMSSRLLACCGLIPSGSRVADIGCDHGYLGIYLLTQGIARSTIESDVAPQPLESAKRNGAKFHTLDRMTFYLSDGVRDIPRDFDVMVCAGMGADTMISILSDAPWLRDPKYRIILQCQSRRPELRRWLSDNGFAIESETLAKDGKFIYPVMAVRYAPGAALTAAQCHLSPALLASGSPLLPEFYDRVVAGIRTSVAGLTRSGGDRLEEFQSILADLEALEDQIHDYRT